MPGELSIILLVAGIIIAIIGGFYTQKVGEIEAFVGFFLLMIGIVMAVIGAINLPSLECSLLSELGDEPRNVIIVSLDNEEICGVFEGEMDVVCVDRERILNLVDPALGEETAGPPFIGVKYEANKVEIKGEEGILLTNTSVPFPCTEE